MSIKKVIDLSKWNPVSDYKKVAKDVDGVILRCGFRGLKNGTLTEDPLFKTHAKAFIDNKVPLGVYFFSTAVNAAEGKAEADYAISLVKSLGIELSFPIAIDTEYSNATHTGRSDSLSKDDRTTAVVAFCERVKSKGYTPMIYASESWFRYNLNYEDVKVYKKWIANYSKKPTFGTDNLVGWQYSSKATINGIDKNVDINEWYGSIGGVEEVVETKPVESTTTALNTGAKLNLSGISCYASSTTAKVASTKNGTFYIWSDSVRNGRIRITNSAANVGKANAITGWINVSDLDDDDTVLTAGTKVELKKVNCYASSATAKVASVKTGTFYIWSASVVKDRIRITNSKANVGKTNAITGWINVSDL